MLAVEDLDDEPAIHQQGRRRVAPLQPEEAVLLLQVMSPDHLFILVQGGDDSPDGDRPYQHAIRHRRGGGVVVLAVHVIAGVELVAPELGAINSGDSQQQGLSACVIPEHLLQDGSAVDQAMLSVALH